MCVFVGRMLMCVCPCWQNVDVCPLSAELQCVCVCVCARVCWQSVNEAFVSFLAVSLWAEC